MKITWTVKKIHNLHLPYKNCSDTNLEHVTIFSLYTPLGESPGFRVQTLTKATTRFSDNYAIITLSSSQILSIDSSPQLFSADFSLLRAIPPATSLLGCLSFIFSSLNVLVQFTTATIYTAILRSSFFKKFRLYKTKGTPSFQMKEIWHLPKKSIINIIIWRDKNKRKTTNLVSNLPFCTEAIKP